MDVQGEHRKPPPKSECESREGVIVCPQCGHYDYEVWDYDTDFARHDVTTVWCGVCEEPIQVVTVVKYLFTTSKPKETAASEGADHE